MTAYKNLFAKELDLYLNEVVRWLVLMLQHQGSRADTEVTLRGMSNAITNEVIHCKQILLMMG